jgi:hypothetical protein
VTAAVIAAQGCCVAHPNYTDQLSVGFAPCLAVWVQDTRPDPARRQGYCLPGVTEDVVQQRTELFRSLRQQMVPRVLVHTVPVACQQCVVAVDSGTLLLALRGHLFADIGVLLVISFVGWFVAQHGPDSARGTAKGPQVDISLAAQG